MENPPPSGLVVVIEDKPQQDQLDLKALHNPSIRGVALQIHWRDIERVQGNPDWSKLDQLFAAAESSKKWVQLLIFPGFFSPAWALEGVETRPFPLQYGPGKGSVEKLPMPWDKVYLSRWLAFMKELSERYGKSPSFRVIAAAGPTSVSAESTLPGNPEDIKKWLEAGYSPHRYLEAWQQMIKALSTEFPNQYISLSLGFGLKINGHGQPDAAEPKHTKQALLDLAIGILPRRLVLQWSNLDGVPGPERGPHGTEFVINYNGKLITGFQLRTSCERNSGNMGAEGNPPMALKQAINKGMAPNTTGHHVNYLEIYEPDVLADDLQPVLHYGASLFAR